ncbi:MAG: NUDIX hydrolase [bacterium]|nr:NUDIX hydrolase [bacterium]
MRVAAPLSITPPSVTIKTSVMAKQCDSTSVGQILKREGASVLIERKNYPQAIALPAGHLDGDNYAAAALRETSEEVGVLVGENRRIWQGRIENPCKREGGDHHLWEVYEAGSFTGELKAGDDAKSYFLATPEELRRLAKRTEYFMKKFGIVYTDVNALTRAIFGNPADKATDAEWKGEMGLEPVWYFILKQIGVI